jgi:hypothetical protein
MVKNEVLVRAKTIKRDKARVRTGQNLLKFGINPAKSL